MFALGAGALALHAVIYTVVQVPYMALTPELAPDYAARTTLTGLWHLRLAPCRGCAASFGRPL